MPLNRRQFVTLAAAVLPVTAQDVSHETLLEVVAQFASGLSEGNAEAAIEQLEMSVPAMSKLAYQVRSMISNDDVSAIAEPLEWIEGPAVILDWFFELKSQDAGGSVVRKHERVTCRFGKKGKRWKIVSLEPATFFSS